MYWLLQEAMDLMKAVPATFWGVVIGSFFTLSGVILSNRASERRMRAQFEHDRDLRARERDLNLRKEIYLAAAEALNAGLEAVGRLGNIDVPLDKAVEVYADKAPAIAKVHVIAREETFIAVGQLSVALNQAILQLTTKRIPLTLLQGRIASMSQLLDGFQKESAHALELMRNYNIEGTVDLRRFEAIEGQFKFEQNRINETVNERFLVQKELMSKQLVYIEESLGLAGAVTALIAPVVIAVRRELELPFDEDAYRRMVADLQERQRADATAALQEIQSMFARLEQEVIKRAENKTAPIPDNLSSEG
jgi:hypothetical protein